MEQLLTDFQRGKHEGIQDLCHADVEPFAAQWDRDQRIPDSAISTIAQRGCLGCCLPPNIGGQGWDILTFGLLNEAFGRGSSALTGC